MNDNSTNFANSDCLAVGAGQYDPRNDRLASSVGYRGDLNSAGGHDASRTASLSCWLPRVITRLYKRKTPDHISVLKISRREKTISA